MNKEIECDILGELVGATLELENLKPHISNKQLEASNRIRKHIIKIRELMQNET
jgi:hypothetical protein